MKQTDPLDVESVILDAELLIKYHLPDRGILALESALDHHPTNIKLREKLLELYVSQKKLDMAASQCIALSGLYVRAGSFEDANHYLMQARNLNPQAAVSSKLQELRKMQQAQQRLNTPQVQVIQSQPAGSSTATLSGSLSDISIFDIVQIIENNHLTGVLEMTKNEMSGKVYFTDGEIVNATLDSQSGVEAFTQLMHQAKGSFFSFEKSPVAFVRQIEATNNTSLILNLLREYDEENKSIGASMEA